MTLYSPFSNAPAGERVGWLVVANGYSRGESPGCGALPHADLKPEFRRVVQAVNGLDAPFSCKAQRRGKVEHPARGIFYGGQGSGHAGD
jgi:hypothetical protein